MEALTQGNIEQIIEEIQGSEEVSRRARFDRRHVMYRDGGKKYLIEQLKREFDEQAVNEMRLCPINILKKIVNKRSVVYKVPPTRTTTEKTDQELVDYYSKKLNLNSLMQKANRYFNLHANTVLYVRPDKGTLKLDVVPPMLYSIVSNPTDKTKVDAWVFSAFNESGIVAPSNDLDSATGNEGFNRSPGTSPKGDLIESQENEDISERNFVIWTDRQHLTTDAKGNAIFVNPELGDEQFLNPIEVSPVVNITKERDNEPWSNQFEDVVDLCLAIMLGWSDVLTVAKNQGFSILTVVSQEEPKQLKVGVNRAVWLRRLPDQEAPSISYVQAQSPLGEYRALLLDLLAILLSSNDMPPNSVGGMSNSRSFTSGFHALIEMSDIIEAVEADKPILRNAEENLWQLIAKWHNWLFDIGTLDTEAMMLGKFSNGFKASIAYRDIKPIESESETIASVKELAALRLITRKNALKRLNPDLTEEQLDQMIDQIDKEFGRLLASIDAKKEANKNIEDDQKDITEESKQEDTTEEEDDLEEMQMMLQKSK
jgi:hypothetical protein